MSNINAISSSNRLLHNTRAQSQSQPLDAASKGFTRRTETTDARVASAGKDKAIYSAAALANEIETLFPHPGVHHFMYDQKSCVLHRMSNGSILIDDNMNRFVKVKNGKIVDEHVAQGDISDFLKAARQAQ